jgi:hypothetical protein
MTASEEPAAPGPGLSLTPVFGPAQAAGILRGLGLTDMTECALRTRAYRKQIPFHMNGRRITFTVDDLRDIAEGQARCPSEPAEPRTSAASAVPKTRRPQRPAASPAGPADPDPWRARRPRNG